MPRYRVSLDGHVVELVSPWPLSKEQQLFHARRILASSKQPTLPVETVASQHGFSILAPTPPQRTMEDTSRFTITQNPPTLQRLAQAQTVEQAKRRAQQQRGDVSPTNLLRILYDMLSIPFRAGVSAIGASLPGRVYGAEAGKPVTLQGDWQQRFWQMYADPELEWGAVLEKDAPFLPRLLRQVIAIPLDVVADPLALLPPAKVAGVAGRVPAIARAGSKAATAARAVGSAIMNPSSTKAAAAVALENDAPRLLDVLLFVLHNPEQAAQVGARAAEARKVAEGGLSALDDMIEMLFSRPGAERVARLSSRDTKVAEQAAREAEQAAARARVQALREVDARLESSRDALEQVARLYDDDDWMSASRLHELITFGRTSDEMREELLRQLLPRKLTAPDAARLRELLRMRQELATNPSAAQQALSLWKLSKTALNFPSSAIRNFYQNFVLSWLAGDRYTPTGIARGLWDIIANWREPWQKAGESVARASESGADVLERSWLRRVVEPVARAYQTADTKAASALSKMTGMPAETFLLQHQYLPETAHILSRSGMVPFISWYLYSVPRWARGLSTAPQRTRSFLQLLMTLQPHDAEDLETIRLPGTKRKRAVRGEMPSEMRVGPLLPADPTEYVGEPGSWLPFIRQNPYVQLSLGGQQALAGQGVRGARYASTGEPMPDLFRFLWYFTAPSVATKYIPELIQPRQAQPNQRVPRDRIDALLSLFGFSASPADDRYDRYIRQREEQRRQASKRRFQR